MARVRLLLKRRVPAYVALPIVVACGATGYLVSTTVLPRTTTSSQTQIHRLAEPGDPAADPQPKEPSGATVGDGSFIALPTSEIDLPVPASTVLERSKAEP